MTRWLWFLLATACAPAYRPPAPFVPMLDARGDLHGAVHLGLGGAQGDVAYAVSDVASVRGGVQVAGYHPESPGTYVVGTAGGGAYGSEGDLRWGIAGTVGGGRSVGETVVRTTINDETTEQRYRNSGVLFTAALRPELGAEGKYTAAGIVLGTSFYQLHHDAASDGSGVGWGLMFEPVAVTRVGPPGVAVEGHVGLAVPMAEGGDVGLVFPLVFGVGVTVDAKTRPPPALPPPAR